LRAVLSRMTPFVSLDDTTNEFMTRLVCIWVSQSRKNQGITLFIQTNDLQKERGGGYRARYVLRLRLSRLLWDRFRAEPRLPLFSSQPSLRLSHSVRLLVPSPGRRLAHLVGRLSGQMWASGLSNRLSRSPARASCSLACFRTREEARRQSYDLPHRLFPPRSAQARQRMWGGVGGSMVRMQS